MQILIWHDWITNGSLDGPLKQYLQGSALLLCEYAWNMVGGPQKVVGMRFAQFLPTESLLPSF